MDMLDRFRGCLLGAAAGDALGMPTEGYTAYEIRSLFGQVRDMMQASAGHFHTGLLAGQFTDDTEETLILAESLIESFGFSPDRFADRLIAWGMTWKMDERLNRGVGFATRSAVESMIAGTPWQESGHTIPTCGAAMRAAPIGLLYNFDLNIVKSYADLQSLPTHCSPPRSSRSHRGCGWRCPQSEGLPKRDDLEECCFPGQPGGRRLCKEASLGWNSLGSAAGGGLGSDQKLSPGFGDRSRCLLLLPEIRA